MHTFLCHDFLVQQEQEGLADPHRTWTVTLPDHTCGKHLECESGHKIHLSANGETWPCNCCSPEKLGN
jgi:hypothetical protein